VEQQEEGYESITRVVFELDPIDKGHACVLL